MPNALGGEMSKKSGIPWFITEHKYLIGNKNSGYFKYQYQGHLDGQQQMDTKDQKNKFIGLHESDFVDPKEGGLNEEGKVLVGKIAEIIELDSQKN